MSSHSPSIVLQCVLIAAFSVPLVAQADAPMDMSPAKEVQKFKRLLGSWDGTGTATMSPGGPTMEWQSKTVMRWAMDGHFVQDDTIIDIGPDAPGKLHFRSYLGFNKETKKFLAVGVSNMGSTDCDEIKWADDDTFLYASSGEEEGEIYHDRWITKLGKDTWSLEGWRSLGAGREFLHVKGTYKRAKKSMRADALRGAGSFVPASDQMSRLARAAGSYTFKGKMIPAPGAPEMTISGREKVSSVFGGTALVFEVAGDAAQGMPAYRGFAAMSWDGDNDCYKMVFVNNMGECGTANSRWLDKRTVITVNAGLRFGNPMVDRSLMKVGEDGAIKAVVSHSIIADQEPGRTFALEMVKQPDRK